MKEHELNEADGKELILNTNEVMNDYEFYLKIYVEEQRLDFERA